MSASLARLTEGGFSIGIEAPLDNDWTHAGDQARQQAGRLPGEPDLQRHADLAQLADRLGFRALWVRDVPVYDSKCFPISATWPALPGTSCLARLP